MRDRLIYDKSKLAAIVLCGGKSSRMGQPKHMLQFGEVTVLERILNTLASVTATQVVVASPDQELPPLPQTCLLVRDQVQHQGPLSGLMYGMEALNESPSEAVYLSGCDVPLLKSEFVVEMVTRLGDSEIVVPQEDRFLHPLAGVYRISLLAKIQDFIQAGERKPRQLIESSNSNRVSVESLRTVDPDLLSLRNMNTPEAYEELLELSQND